MHSLKAYHAPVNDFTPMHTQSALNESSGFFLKRAYEKFLASSLIWKDKFLRESYFYIMNYKQPMMTRRRRITLSQIWATLLVIQNRAVNSEMAYTWTTKTDKASCIYMYLCVQHRCTHTFMYTYVFICVCMCNNNSKRRGCKFDSKERHRRGMRKIVKRCWRRK